MENQQQEMNLTPEELAERKEEMLKFYTDSLPYLEAQYKYEETLMKLDEVRFKRTNIQMQFAMMIQAQEEDSQEERAVGSDFDVDKVSNATTTERKLKKS
jgi:hypothetical protein